MKIPRSLGLCCGALTATAFAACSEPQLSPSGLSLSNPQQTVGHSSGSPSWMAPEAKAEDLLYVSLSSGGVDVFAYPSGKRIGKLTGTEEPNGECVDSKGDVFITDAERSVIIEYAHAGTQPIAILSDPGSPEDCSIDAATGNLAVANVSDEHSRDLQGNVDIYSDAKGAPKRFSNRDLYAAWHCGYDGNGNLFVSGRDWSLEPIYLELPKGRHAFERIHLKGIRAIGGIKWDGKDIAVGGNRHKLHQTAGDKVLGSTLLEHSGSLGQFWIEGSVVIVPNGGSDESVGFWNYPAGGKPTKIIPVSRGFEPVGAAVSKVP